MLLIELFGSRIQLNIMEWLGSISSTIEQNRTKKFVWERSIVLDFRTNQTQSNLIKPIFEPIY